MNHKPKNPAAVALGSLGGRVKGKSKARGDAEYYRELAAKSAASRKKSGKVGGRPKKKGKD